MCQLCSWGFPPCFPSSQTVWTQLGRGPCSTAEVLLLQGTGQRQKSATPGYQTCSKTRVQLLPPAGLTPQWFIYLQVRTKVVSGSRAKIFPWQEGSESKPSIWTTSSALRKAHSCLFAYVTSRNKSKLAPRLREKQFSCPQCCSHSFLQRTASNSLQAEIFPSYRL